MQDEARRTHRSVTVLLAVLLGMILPVGLESSASAATRTGAYEKAMVRAVNIQRAARDLPPLRPFTRVAECYDRFAERGARSLQRTGVAAYTVARASDACPRAALGEALGRVKVRAARLVGRWMRDSDRRSMLLHSSADHIAVGAVRNSRGVWSVDLYVVAGRWGAEDSTGSGTTPDSSGSESEDSPSEDSVSGENSETSAVDGGDSTTETSAARSEMLAAVNGERAEIGVRRLAVLACIQANAQRHAQRMARTGVLAHQSLEDVQEECGRHRRVGENVAVNSRGAGAVMVEQWMASRPHRASILEGEYRYVGVGAAQGADGRWWGVLLLFGAPVG